MEVTNQALVLINMKECAQGKEVSSNYKWLNYSNLTGLYVYSLCMQGQYDYKLM